MLSSMPISWETLRQLEQSRDALMIDPSKLVDSLNALEKEISPEVIKVATRLGERLIERYHKDEPKIVYSFELLEERLWEMPYFTRPVLASELPSIWYALKHAYPWTIFLMITDPYL
jgi:hypothetical protein